MNYFQSKKIFKKYTYLPTLKILRCVRKQSARTSIMGLFYDYYFLLNDECAIIDSSCIHVRVMKTPYTPPSYNNLSVHFAKDIFSLITLSDATAIVSVDTKELGVYVANHYFCLFTLSVATATVSADTIEHAVHIANHHFHFVYTKCCYCNRKCRHYRTCCTHCQPSFSFCLH